MAMLYKKTKQNTVGSSQMKSDTIFSLIAIFSLGPWANKI